MGSADQMIAYVESQIGKWYKWATAGPDTFDCSGLIYAAGKSAGITLGRTTYQQITNGTEVKKSELLPGDLIFPSIEHVQIFVGGNMVIEAPHEGAQVRKVAMWGFWRARRVATPGSSVGGSATDTIKLGNPLDPRDWPIVKQLNTIATQFLSPVFWRRMGMASLGMLVILLAIVFINRKKIESAAVAVAKNAPKIAEVAAL